MSRKQIAITKTELEFLRVKEFIEENSSFFYSPLPKFSTHPDHPEFDVAKESAGQREFLRYYQELDLVRYMQDYSNNLKKLLYEVKIPIARNASRPAIYYWYRGSFDPALADKKIRAFLLANRNHPAIILWKNKDLIPARTEFNLYLNDLMEKSVDLSKRGYHKDAELVNSLCKNLIKQRNFLLLDKQDKEEFVTNCFAIINTFQVGDLQKHRGIFGPVLCGIQNILWLFTFGLVQVSPTDTIRKTEMMKKTIFKIYEDAIQTSCNTVPVNSEMKSHDTPDEDECEELLEDRFMGTRFG